MGFLANIFLFLQTLTMGALLRESLNYGMAYPNYFSFGTVTTIMLFLSWFFCKNKHKTRARRIVHGVAAGLCSFLAAYAILDPCSVLPMESPVLFNRIFAATGFGILTMLCIALKIITCEWEHHHSMPYWLTNKALGIYSTALMFAHFTQPVGLPLFKKMNATTALAVAGMIAVIFLLLISIVLWDHWLRGFLMSLAILFAYGGAFLFDFLTHQMTGSIVTYLIPIGLSVIHVAGAIWEKRYETKVWLDPADFFPED